MTAAQTYPMGEVIVEGEHATIVYERHLPHPPETVWEAITDPSELREWYLTRAQIEGRVGGRIEFWAGPAQFHVTGAVLAWDPPRLFEHDWNVEPRPEMSKGEQAIIRWEIVPERDGSLLKLLIDT